jgi:hypothetical protein
MGDQAVVTGTPMTCSMGTAPMTFIATGNSLTNASKLPVGTVNDIVMAVNIPPFLLCKSPSNPAVAAATAAALGVLTPMPCTPMVAGPWSPGSEVAKLAKQKALTKGSTCNCSFGGSISFSSAIQMVMTC